MYRSKASLCLLQRVSLSKRTLQANFQRGKSYKKLSNVKSYRHFASTTKITHQQATAAAAKAEPFLNGTNSNYLDEMYESWLEDPSSVHKVRLKFGQYL